MDDINQAKIFVYFHSSLPVLLISMICCTQAQLNGGDQNQVSVTGRVPAKEKTAPHLLDQLSKRRNHL